LDDEFLLQRKGLWNPRALCVRNQIHNTTANNEAGHPYEGITGFIAAFWFSKNLNSIHVDFLNQKPAVPGRFLMGIWSSVSHSFS
jgi:hypothetical protein